MRLTKHHHACILIEDDRTRILINPGELGPKPLLAGMDAVLVTHGHVDRTRPGRVS